MEGTKEAELVAAVLLYALRCLAEGNQPALTGMNFGPKEVDALNGMKLVDMYRVARLQTHCLNISLNRGMYWPVIERIERERESEQLRQALVRSDAPSEMMRGLYGIGPREYTRLRRLFNLSPSVGRPPDTDEAASHALHEAWVRRLNGREPHQAGAADFLALSEETGVPLRAIWTLTQRWAEFGRENS